MSDTFEIRVESRNCDGFWKIDADENTTIMHVKNMLASETCYTADRIKLYWFREELANDRTLGSYGIEWSVTFHMEETKRSRTGTGSSRDPPAPRRNRAQVPADVTIPP